MGRCSTGNIATHYGLESAGIESRSERFSASSRLVLGPTQPPCKMLTGSFPGVKWPRRGVTDPSHLAPKLKKEYSYTSTAPLGLHVML
jgi:hypothetical protein